MPPTSGVTYSRELVSTPSTRVFGPSRGLGRAVGEGVRRLSKVTSEGKEEKEEGVDGAYAVASAADEGTGGDVEGSS